VQCTYPAAPPHLQMTRGPDRIRRHIRPDEGQVPAPNTQRQGRVRSRLFAFTCRTSWKSGSPLGARIEY
jgi:hypothetical protein